MSIYRRSDGLPSSHIDAQQAKRETPAQPQATPPHRAAPKMGLRKASPASKPLPRTLEWMASLPPDVQPTALLRRYARIANVIAAAWRDSKASRSYMDGLLNDDRGDRQGFPPDVLDELLALRAHYDFVDPETPPLWRDVSKRG
jgi:hypothetical protein